MFFPSPLASSPLARDNSAWTGELDLTCCSDGVVVESTSLMVESGCLTTCGGEDLRQLNM